MNPFIHRNCCGKKIFIRNFGGNLFAPKTDILETSRNWKRLKKHDPPKNSMTFWNHCSLKRKTHFLNFSKANSGQNIHFWEKSFCTAVPMQKTFHMAPSSPPLKSTMLVVTIQIENRHIYWNSNILELEDLCYIWCWHGQLLVHISWKLVATVTQLFQNCPYRQSMM